MADTALSAYVHDFAEAPAVPAPGTLRGYQDLAADEYGEWYPIWRSIEGRPLRWREPPGKPEWRTWLQFNETPARSRGRCRRGFTGNRAARC